MNDGELGTRLREAAPRVTVPLGLSSHRERILQEARQRRGHGLRLWSAGLAASALLVGGGSVAFGGDGNLTPWGWVADQVFSFESATGSICVQGIRVMREGSGDDDPLLAEAKAFISDLDLESLDTSRAEERIRSGRERLGRVVSDGDIKQLAIHDVVADLLWAHLDDRAENLDPEKEFYLSSVTEACE
ncbi:MULTISPECIES: hypothetical protein [unclassified Microbacterium]|uniref:hypothetical protein n=1 Tax=Microbacterium TaxID=33882 RepID=UPI003BA02C2D